MRRLLKRTLYAKLALALVLGFVVGLAYLRLNAGPVRFAGLPERVATALADRIGQGWNVTLADTAIELQDGSLALRARGLDIRNPEGVLVLRAPDAVVSVDNWSLARIQVLPRAIELRDLQLRALLNRDGSLNFVAPGDGAPELPPGAAAAPAASPAPAGSASPVSGAVASLFGMVLDPSSIVGALDRASLSNARLTILDDARVERAVFDRFDAVFERDGDGRRFDMRLNGPRGAWHIAGGVKRTEGGSAGTIEAREIPIQDVVLLAGLSALPASTDLKLSGTVDAKLRDGRVETLEGAFGTKAGEIAIDDRDLSPIAVETTSGHLAWDEGRRTLLLRGLAFKGRGNDLRLSGEIETPHGDRPWRVALSGRDLTLSGPETGEAPIRADELALNASFRDGAAALQSLVVKGPKLDATVEASYGAPADAGGLRVTGRAARSGVRAILRLWPESVAPGVRRYLVANLRAGEVETLAVTAVLSRADLVKANAGERIPEESVRVAFSIADAELKVASGLPPLTGLAVSGTVTGSGVAIRAPKGQIQMADGRALALSDGSFALADYWPKTALAQIGFLAQGGADALASFLQTPTLRPIANVDTDPSLVKGRAELRIGIPLAVNDIPSFADLPVSVSGILTDLSIDKVLGKERLEGGTLSVTYDKGALGIRGEGRIGGTPTLIDLRQPRNGAGEITVSMTLDEAARARKGIAFGSQLTGPVPVKAVVPLAKGARGTRIEADLSKATVDNVIPGWTKPAGRPGKLTFTLHEGPSTELKDLVLESGSVLVRGTATLGGEAGLEKADLSTFKLSPGDDVRAQLERSNGVYKVTVRGNLADARPFAKSFGSPAGNARQASQSAKDTARDVDLDMAVNILTGHNDEALTNVSLKLASRKGDLRQLQFQGRLKSAPVVAQLTTPERRGSLLTVQSDDAGGLLRFLDIYRRMTGGALVLQTTMDDGPQQGLVQVDRFMLRDEPALRRIVPSQIQSATTDERGRVVARVDTSEVAFTKLKAEFSRSATRIDFKDATIWGAQVGFTLAGWVDYGRDRADINGTFVPAYGLNNAFAQVPLFGPLLGGGQNEGLFAVNFRVSGQASAPTLTVNPLSAIAPGFLRKLFGAGGPAVTDSGGRALQPPVRMGQ
ncbi:MAG TPA: DUF3971 domain-containing protein [Beijerinckiaceae bacterium]|jgi:hypothetical protein